MNVLIVFLWLYVDWNGMHYFCLLSWFSFLPSFFLLTFHFANTLIVSNRVEAWTRNVNFLLQQEGRPVAELTGNKTSVRVMQKDWETTDEAATWIRKKATNLTQPFVLYLGLNLPHPYPSPSSGENYGSSTFLTSPYWLQKVCRYCLQIILLIVYLNSHLCII